MEEDLVMLQPRACHGVNSQLVSAIVIITVIMTQSLPLLVLPLPLPDDILHISL